MMGSALELIIDEATTGHFFWIVVQRMQAGEAPVVVDFAGGPLPSRASAMAEGTIALGLRQVW